MKQQGTKSIQFADIQIIKSALKRDRNLKVCFGLFLLLLSIGLLIIVARLFPAKSVFALSVFLLLSGFTGLYFFLQGLLRYDTQRNHLLKLLLYQPDQVVWVYYRKVENIPFGIRIFNLTTLFICLRNRDFIALPMSEPKIRQLIDLLKLRLPNTVFGYTIQRAQLYDISPDLVGSEKEY
ncbi:MAG: hypothetical protein IPM47_05735 [Sphingobacteriales bacterium]|nr:MAG: hypothetical protein IPM47_05735 [Sphingobacteriales bacterium]